MSKMRQQRITTSQQEIYLIYLSNNQAFAAAAIQEGVTDDFEENWIELTKILNATLGPKKSAEEWKLVFLNWKTQLKARAKKFTSADGSEKASLALQKMTDIEKRALKLWKEEFQDKQIATASIKQILNEIENKDITITPIKKKRKISSEGTFVVQSKASTSSPQIQSVQQIHPPQIPMHPQPVQIHTQMQPLKIPMHVHMPNAQPAPKDDFSEFINIKFESIEDLLHTSNNNEKAKTDIQEILSWAKNYHIADTAVEALLGILKMKRVKTEVKSESNVDHYQQQTMRLFNRLYARVEKMESTLVQRIVQVERKVDQRPSNMQQLKPQNK